MKELLFFKGKDCPRCPSVRKMLDEVAGAFEVKEIYMDDEEGYLTALTYQVRSAPAIIIGGEICSRVEEMREFVERHGNGE